MRALKLALSVLPSCACMQLELFCHPSPEDVILAFARFRSGSSLLTSESEFVTGWLVDPFSLGYRVLSNVLSWVSNLLSVSFAISFGRSLDVVGIDNSAPAAEPSLVKGLRTSR